MSEPKTRRKPVAKKPSSHPMMMFSIIAGIALIAGMMIGGNAGPIKSFASPSQSEFTVETPTLTQDETPAIEPEQATRDSLLVSHNTGPVNLGGEHHHYHETTPNRTPESEVQPTTVTKIVEVEVPVYVEVERESREPVKPERKKIWTRPGIPQRTRLGRTMATIQRFENAGVRLFVEE